MWILFDLTHGDVTVTKMNWDWYHLILLSCPLDCCFERIHQWTSQCCHHPTLMWLSFGYPTLNCSVQWRVPNWQKMKPSCVFSQSRANVTSQWNLGHLKINMRSHCDRWFISMQLSGWLSKLSLKMTVTWEQFRDSIFKVIMIAFLRWVAKWQKTVSSGDFSQSISQQLLQTSNIIVRFRKWHWLVTHHNAMLPLTLKLNLKMIVKW